MYFMKCKKQDINLLNRAYEIEQWAEKHFIDPNGVVYTHLEKSSAKPITDSFFSEEDKPFIVPGYRPAEIANYENCGMTTGAYLQSQLYRYAVEKKPESIQKARRCFKALKYIYEIGKQLEEGFFPKIWGNKFTTQTSTDQVLYAVMSMDHYFQYADKREKAEIDRMITSMVNFWVKRDYKYKYYTIENMQWPLGRFPSLLLVAYNHSGDSKFKDEYNRLLSMGVNQFPSEEQLRPKIKKQVAPIPYEQKMNAWLIAHMADSLTMCVMQCNYLLLNDKDNYWSESWKGSIRQIWDEAKLTFSPDGKMYIQVLVGMDTQEVKRPAPAFLDEPEPAYSNDETGFQNLVQFHWISGAKTGWSTMAARAGVQAYHHLRDETMIPAILNILNSVDLKGLTYLDDPERFLPELRHKTRYYSGDAMANWLWAYWQGRHDGVWNECEV